MKPPRIRRRWSNNDRHFGPFTYSRDKGYRPLGVMLNSGSDEFPGCSLRLQGFGHTLIVELPPVIRPWRRWIDTSKHAWAGPNGGYWDEHAREYGFSVSDNFLQVHFGAQTHDSTTTQDWSCFLPWRSWRFFRYSLFDLQGAHFWTQLESDYPAGTARFEAQRFWDERVPKAVFVFNDFDGEEIRATTHIEEREWRFGTKWCSWLSLFRRPRIRRSLDINFDKETGRKKGSWKGGTLGHGIDMLPGELHEAAFRRYCAEHSMTFVGAEPAAL